MAALVKLRVSATEMELLDQLRDHNFLHIVCWLTAMNILRFFYS
jgi:hypothetical protein